MRALQNLQPYKKYNSSMTFSYFLNRINGTKSCKALHLTNWKFFLHILEKFKFRGILVLKEITSCR